MNKKTMASVVCLGGISVAPFVAATASAATPVVSGTVKVAEAQPTATPMNDKATTKQDTAVLIDVLGNDKANPGTIDKTALTLFDTTGAPTDEIKVTGGTATLKGDQVLFTPTKGFAGVSGSFTYGAATSDGVTYQAKVTVTVEEAGSTATATPTPSSSSTATPTPSKSSTATATSTATPTPSKSSTATATASPTGTSTSTATSTAKPVPSNSGSVGPVVQTDMASTGGDLGPAGLAGLAGGTVGAGLIGAAALRRRKR